MTKSASELFIVDNSDSDWKVRSYLSEWCELSKAIDIATGYFEIGALLCLKEKWQAVDKIRILMGDEVSFRTKRAFEQGLRRVNERLDQSLEAEKNQNDFLEGVPAIVEAIRAGKIECRVYRKEKFHAKAYITHARTAVIGSFGLVGSSNFTFPGLSDNVELNVQLRGADVGLLQAWYEQHWEAAEDISPEILRTLERHIQPRTPFEIWFKSLDEFFRGQALTPDLWDQQASHIFKILDKYQQDAYKNLIAIANANGGAFLCDGVGLGKTFVGLMLLERSHLQADRIKNYLDVDVDAYCENRPKDAALAQEGKWKHPGWLSERSDTLPRKFNTRWLTAHEWRMGDFITFNMTMIHGSLDNATDRIRLSSDTRYQRASELADERWIGPKPIGHSTAGKRGRIC